MGFTQIPIEQGRGLYMRGIPGQAWEPNGSAMNWGAFMKHLSVLAVFGKIRAEISKPVRRTLCL